MNARPPSTRLEPPRRRVLVVITLAEVGGAQAYVAALLPCLGQEFDVAVAAHGTGPVRDAATAAGVSFHPLRHLRRPVNPWRDVLALVELVSLMRRLQPHAIHANSSKAGSLARLAGLVARVPVRIYTVHGWAFGAHGGAAGRLYAWVERLLRPATSLFICVSESERRAGIALRACSAEKTVVVPPAIDVTAAPQTTPTDGRVRLVTVGRMRPPKDPFTLVQALAASTPAVEAVFVGDGPQRASVEAQVERLGLSNSVVLAGERRDVRELLAAADVFVLSSRSEALPVSIIEAMAAGLPVVASAVGGVPDLVTHEETGLLVPPGDADALASAIRRLVADPELRRRLGTAGRARAEERFDLPAFCRAHLAAYRTAFADCSPNRTRR